MAAKELLILFSLLAGTRAWLGEYACENVLRFGSRADVEQCFQDKFPEQVAEAFLRCAQNSDVSRAFTVLQDYCQDDRFQDEVNNCMNQAEDITLVTQNVAFRTLRTCLDWVPRSIPDESSESSEDSGRAIRKRDVENNEIDTDEKPPKEGEKNEEIPDKSEGNAVTEDSIAPHTEAAPSLVTEIISAIDTLTEKAAEEEANEASKDKEIGEEIGLDIEPNKVVDEKANDIPPEDIAVTESHEDAEEKGNDVKEDVEEKTDQVDEEAKNDKEEQEEDEKDETGGDNDIDDGKSSEETDKDDDDNDDDQTEDEDNASDEVDKDDDDDNSEDQAEDEDNPSVETDKDDDDNSEEQTEDEEENPSEEDDDNSSATVDDEDDTSINNDSDEEFSFADYDYPIGFFGSYEDDRSREIINERYNRINFAIYVNKK